MKLVSTILPAFVGVIVSLSEALPALTLSHTQLGHDGTKPGSHSIGPRVSPSKQARDCNALGQTYAHKMDRTMSTAIGDL